MASHRPAYSRYDTDQNGTGLQEVQAESSSSPKKDWREDDAESLKGQTKAKVSSFDGGDGMGNSTPGFSEEIEDHFGEANVLHTAKDVLTHILHVDDDPTLSPWTIRAFAIAIGLAVFASVLQEIFYFKPQVIYVSVTFLTVIAYPLGQFLAFALPKKGKIGRWLNPGPFNGKEHAAIAVMAASAANAAVSTEIIAAQKLYYNESPNAGSAIFLTLSSQLLAYGLAGLLRGVLVRPTNLLWPVNLPINTLLETLHRDKSETKTRLKVFYICFFFFLVYEIIPEWFFPLLQGVSIFCLANRSSLLFTNLFGGSQGNEGLGFLSISFDWQYVASLGSPLWVPLQTQLNSLVGYLLCIVTFMAVYYGNIWRSYDFPFLSQLLYDGSQSNGTVYTPYNLTTILTPENLIDEGALQQQGIPYLTGTYIVYLITTNMGFTATIVHMCLWNWVDIKAGFSWISLASLKKVISPSTYKFWEPTDDEAWRQKQLADPRIDPHYKLMIKNGYEECPNWWYGALLVISFVIGLGTCYSVGSTMPWWGYILSNVFCAIFILFFTTQFGITGFGFNLQPIAQMIAGYIHPNRPLANMYFTVFAYNGQTQGSLMARDLKLAQNAHLSFKATYTFQVLGCVIGAIFNYIMMTTIVSAQSDILKSVEGSNVWSGQTVQQYNTLAIAWSIAGDMFSVGAKYQWVTIAYLVGFIVPVPFWLAYRYTKIEFFRYMNLAIILWYMGWLFVGINSSIFTYFALGIGAQWWLRKYHPGLFVKYNYLVSAALDGGTQVLVFILSFAVFGGSGKAVDFPTWAGNNGGVAVNKNIDFCAFNPANAS